jgi:hypothetical protein
MITIDGKPIKLQIWDTVRLHPSPCLRDPRHQPRTLSDRADLQERCPHSSQLRLAPSGPRTIGLRARSRTRPTVSLDSKEPKDLAAGAIGRPRHSTPATVATRAMRCQFIGPDSPQPAQPLRWRLSSHSSAFAVPPSPMLSPARERQGQGRGGGMGAEGQSVRALTLAPARPRVRRPGRSHSGQSHGRTTAALQAPAAQPPPRAQGAVP